jgi:hypothetical protein
MKRFIVILPDGSTSAVVAKNWKVHRTDGWDFLHFYNDDATSPVAIFRTWVGIKIQPTN